MSSVINVRLNEKLTLQFVELYRDQRILWDKEHEGYNKRADRLLAYRRIADGMAVDGMGVPEVASKIKNIRSTYLQEVKKIKDSAQRHLVHRSEDENAVSPYVPKLPWFPILDAMIGGAAVKRPYSSPSTADMLTVNYAYDENLVEYSCAADDSNYYCDEPSSGGGGGIRVKRSRSSSSSERPSPRAKRFQYQRQQSSNTNELFAKYIATSLDALPPRLAVWAQKDMHDVLVKYKLMEFDQDETSSAYDNGGGGGTPNDNNILLCAATSLAGGGRP